MVIFGKPVHPCKLQAQAWLSVNEEQLLIFWEKRYTMVTGKLKTEGQVTIPRRIREVLDLSPGDSVTFEIDDSKKVFMCKAAPVVIEYIRAVEGTLSEWSSSHDEEAYGDL